MKRNFLYALCAAATLATGCAKQVTSGPNEAAKRYFDAWLQVNYPDAKQYGTGNYIIDEKTGGGAEVTKDGYAFVEYIIRDLSGNISSYSSEETARQLGKYSRTAYYGQRIWFTSKNKMMVGISDAVTGIRVGGSRTSIIPSWMMSYYDFDSVDEYLKYDTDQASAIYEIKVTNFTEDIGQWQIDSIGRYFAANPEIYGEMTAADSLSQGFYYFRTKEPADTTSFPTDTAIYINYTGKLLNGLVFDTTVERVAKDNGLWSSSKTYSPLKVTWADKAASLQLDGNTVITGFANTLWQMRPMEHGIGIFWSDLGYGESGSGSSIPGYMPLIFEIEITEAP